MWWKHKLPSQGVLWTLHMKNPNHQIWFCPSQPSTAPNQHLGSCQDNWAENLCRCHLKAEDVTPRVGMSEEIHESRNILIFFFLKAEREIKRQIISKQYLMSFLWRCGEAVLNFNLAKLPWEGSALSLIPGFPHGASAWPWLGPLSKAARWEKKLWGKQVNWSCRRSGCRQGKIAEKGTVSSSRTRRETHQSCKLGNSQVGKKKPTEGGSSAAAAARNFWCSALGLAATLFYCEY